MHTTWMRAVRGGQTIGGRETSAACRARGLARRPSAEMLEPRCLMAGPSLSVTGTTLTETFQKSFTATVASFTTSKKSEPASHFQVTIQWGDGSSSSGTVTANKKVKGGFIVTGTHDYQSGLSKETANISVTDTTTRVSASASTTVKVSGAPVTLVPVAVGAVEGETFSATIAEIKSSSPGTFKGVVTYADGGVNSAKPISFTETSTGVYKLTGQNVLAEETLAGHPDTIAINVTGNVQVGGSTGTMTPVNFTTDTPVTVADAPLTQDGSPPAFNLGTADQVNGVVTFLDAAGADAKAADYSATVNWGDKQTGVLTGFALQSGLVNGQKAVEVPLKHTYGVPGQYTIQVTVKDKGGSSVTLKATVNISSIVTAAPIVTVTPPAGAVEGKPLVDVQIATFTAGRYTAAGQFKAEIDWGDDGNESDGTIEATADPGHFIVLGTHTYAEESPADSPYTLAVTVSVPNTAIRSGSAQGPETVMDAPLDPMGPALTLTAQPGIALSGVTVASFTDENPGDRERLHRHDRLGRR